MSEVLEFLNNAEIRLGAKIVRDDCRKYMLKKTHAGFLPTIRKSIPKSWTLSAWETQDGICPRCKEPISHNDMSGDNKEPLAGGGAHSKWNIQCLHKSCNSSKGANDFVRESKLEQTGRTRRVPIEDEV